MEKENIHKFIHDVGKLKRRDRAGWIRHDVENPESSAEHGFRVAIMAFVLAKRFGLDQNKSLKMGLFHDVPEYQTPDYTPFDDISPEEKYRQEEEAMVELTSQIEEGEEMLELWREFEKGESPEAKFVKGIDKLEMMFQAEEYAQEQPDKDLELFWEMQDDYDFGIVMEVFEILKKIRTMPSQTDSRDFTPGDFGKL